MKTHLILIFFVLNTFFVNAQLSKFLLIDGIDKTPVIYANIKSQNSDFGTSSDSLGNFFFEKKSQVLINAVGYEKIRLDLTQNNSTIELIPKEKLLQEVILFKRKNQNEILLDEFKASKINQYYGLSATQNSSWIIGKFFGNKSYKNKFLKKIKILTKSNVENAIFNVRVYSVDNYGNPSNELYNKNIIGIAKKGKHKTEVDLSFTNVTIPQSGIFIAVDWIKNQKNLYEYKYTTKNSSEKLLGKSYSPSFGTILNQDENKTKIFRGNNWEPVIKDITTNTNSYCILAMELTLTD
ncbi:carboxypeptidase-like regulatory domain-containing protein [Halpernia frigidisoli]|uniref:CarboxypepD_reg-like domain-containing protein n=1 Tax=Halpernia frigidisoli TaxID=1125876 RepID=A0A1I3D5F9_9FLAO|nr:carboxypeptidase-like regulatory domain-containing protein [Halpernia frigidisoli]SFH81952.1 hypothetical protein SAMN05443292_0271 [Halpernia frigidisoli]